MKALVLAAGRGKRLDEALGSRNKCVCMVNGKPVIEYSLDCASRTDVGEIVLVVGYRAEEIINAYGTWYKGKRLKYVVQQEQRGLVHALECAAEMLEGEAFLLLLGDEVLVNPRHQELIEEFRADRPFGLCGVLPVEDKELIKRTYCIVQNGDNVIHRLIEKPRRPLNNLMGTGDCVFRNEILSYIQYAPIHHERKEKELPDLIQCVIDDGNVVKSFPVCDRYTNINTPEDIEMAEGFFR